MTLHAGQQIHKHLLRCDSCGFVHWHPLPDASTVARYYEDDQFYSGDSPHSPPDWFKKEESEYLQGLWDSYYAYLASFLDNKKPVLDIGTGAGWLLAYLIMKSNGNQYVWGVEPSTTARRCSYVSHRISQSLEDVTIKGNIILMLTLEHILNPEAWLREDVLPHLDGRLVVVVPNEWNLLQRWVMGKGDAWFVNKVHLNYFDKDSLRGLLERVGLKVVHEGATFPTEAWLMIPGLDHRKNPDVGRRTHLWRLKLEKRFPGIFHLYEWLGRKWNIGREIVMVAEKK